MTTTTTKSIKGQRLYEVRTNGIDALVRELQNIQKKLDRMGVKRDDVACEARIDLVERAGKHALYVRQR
jgi:hypothetical protein